MSERRLSDVPADEVMAGVGCVYCCVGVGVPCRKRGQRLEVPHAQRWYEYHNATHDRREQIPIYTAYGVQVNRTSHNVAVRHSQT